MKVITILALDGVMDTSLAITLDTLRAAQSLLNADSTSTPVRIRTVGVKTRVTTGSGLQLAVDATFRDVKAQTNPADWIVIPGLGLRSHEEISARLARPDAVEAMHWLRQSAEANVHIAASCVAVFLLAEAGLLAGRRATTTWWLAHLFRKRYPAVSLNETRMLVRDGRLLTAGAALSQLDLMMALIGETMSVGVAYQCSRYLLIDQRPSQARYMMQTHLLHEDSAVIAAEAWIDTHMSEPISVRTLAEELALTPRTLSRRIEGATGLSPIKFIQQRRLQRAMQLLETTSLSIEAIAAQVGYSDGTALRKLVKREFGKTPNALR